MELSPILIVILTLTGIWGTIACRNLIKKVIGLGIVNSGVVMLFVYVGSRSGSHAPILIGQTAGLDASQIVDPLPQALMLTAIVVGVALTSLALVLAYGIHATYGTLDIREAERRAKEQLEPEEPAQ